MLIHGAQKWVRLYSRLPTFDSAMNFEKPTRIATTETLVNEYTGEQLLQIAKSNQDLFGEAELDFAALDTLDPDDVLAYYLNVRYNATPPDHLLPLRRAAVFTQSNHAYSWYILMSAILTKLYDNARLSIDSHTLYRADQLSRVIAQINWIIWEMTKDPAARSNPNYLIIGFSKNTDKNGEYYHLIFDHDKYEQYVASGKTAQDALTHWLTYRTQPN